jgi:hypothetical protein
MVNEMARIKDGGAELAEIQGRRGFDWLGDFLDMFPPH